MQGKQYTTFIQSKYNLSFFRRISTLMFWDERENWLFKIYFSNNFYKFKDNFN